jgi:hypothetical protein
MAKECNTHRQKINSYRILVAKPDGKTTLGRSSRRCVDNIKANLMEMKWSCMDWTQLAQDTDQWRALVNTMMDPRVP